MYFKFKSSILIVSVITITLLLSNCIRKAEFSGYNLPDSVFAGGRMALINSQITLGQAINGHIANSGLIHAGDSSYYFTYKDSIQSSTAESMITFDTVSVNQSVQLPGSGLAISAPLPKDTTISREFQFDNINFANDVSLIYLLLKGGTLGMNVKTQLNQNLSYKITIGAIVDANNNPLVIQEDIIYNSLISTSTKFSSVNLKDYTIVMNKGTSINAKIDITIKPSGQNMPTTDQNLDFTFTVKNLKFKRLVGKIKNMTFPSTSQNTELNAFNNDFIKKIKFADPSVKFTFENSLGVPISINFDQIEAIHGDTITKLQFTKSDSLPNFSIIHPNTFQFGQSALTSITLDKNDCPNLIDFLYSSPDHLKFTIDGTIGSGTGSNDTLHFIEDVSKIKVNYELKVPIFGQISKLSISKTTGYKFPENMYLDTITLTTDIENHVPLNAKIQIFFTDADTNHILDSMFVGKNPTDNLNIFEAASNIDANGRAQKPTIKKTHICRNREWWDRVGSKTRFLIVVGTFYTPEGKDVKFYSDEAIKIIVDWSGKGGARIDIK